MYIFIFFIYSFIGWLYESTVCSLITQKRLINRGFLHGPICPIYGVGAVLNWILFSDVENVYALFFASAFVSGVTEYMISAGMEYLFEARWWDYSNFKFNLNGRVCLYGILIFGISNTFMVLFITPELIIYYFKYNNILSIIMNLLLILLSADLFLTLNNWINFTERLSCIKEQIKQKNISIPKLSIPRSELRIIKAFPKLKFVNSDKNSILDKIRKIKKGE